jgi:type III pantothenate kinase
MLLAVDVGNSTTKVGLFRGDELVEHWRLSTSQRRSSDEEALELAGLLRFARLRLDQDVDGLVVGSVVPPVTELYRELAERYLDGPALIVEPGVRTGLALRHEHPQDLGADRIVNAVAAQALYGGPAIVVDFGTAISFDAVDAKGAFVGGAIAPGVSTATEALIERAARLPTVEIVPPASSLGRSTVAALQSGIVHGFAGLVDRLVEQIRGELGPGVTTIATGLVVPAVLHACETIDHHDPWLTLKGLRLVWERNQA